ncbi:MAG TPA: tetratricopeptide repeat-containing glycosyltransferase family protein [Alphaproteobacteria bacterium]|nr:tetratricopeptide repeat-containing glycosyltransferase family protein [Alphaproteobacteria bacterium]
MVDSVSSRPLRAANNNIADADAAYERGVALQAAGRLHDAIEAWRKALESDPRHTPALYNCAVGLALAGDAAGAVAAYEHLLDAQPDHRDGLYNLANLHMRARRCDESAGFYRRLIAKHPAFAPGWINYALCEAERRRPAESEALLRRALALDPHNANAHWNLSHILLARHEWKEAWQQYEWRLKRAECPKPPVDAPDWPGNHPSARRILLWNDQGLGDALQFLRYAEPLAEQGHEVYVFVQDALKNIAATAKGVTRVIGASDPVPEVDAQAPLLSLPHRLPLADPKESWRGPYLRAPKPMDLPCREGHRAIGIAWAGNPDHPNDAIRSMHLRGLAPLFDLPGIDWFSLQVGSPAAQIGENNLAARLHDFSPRLRNFTDTASAMMACDLVITVDTAVAHLAGALGRPAYVMLSPAREWRWAGQESESLWYPTLRLFRQKEAGDWGGVVAAIKGILEANTQLLSPQPPVTLFP